MTPEQVASKLSARKSASGWTAKCPAHEDKTASLSITEGRDGRVLLHCHAGCKVSDIASAMGIEMGELFAPDEAPKKERPKTVASYQYRDESGDLLYEVLRLEPKSFRQRKPNHGGTGWLWKLGDVRRVLYRLPELKKLAKGTVVFVVEGEKDADALVSLGLQATTNAGGADKWPSDSAQQLAGLRVVCIPDNDQPGAKHAARVNASMAKADIRSAVLKLPGLPEKGDVSDWLADDGTKERLIQLAKNALSESRTKGFASSADRMRDADRERRENLKHVQPYNVSYLDDELLGVHPHDIVIIMAATGAGKTTLGSILAQRAAEAGKRVRFFALEAYQNEIETRTLYREVCRVASQNGVWRPYMTQQMWIKQGISELDAHTSEAISNLEKTLQSLETYYRGSRFDRDDIEREFMSCKGKVDMIILDHLHYIDGDGASENSELKKIIQVIRDCGQALKVPVIVIAHVRKKMGGKSGDFWIPQVDDIHGSSDVAKIATTIVAVAPAREEGFISTDPDVSNTFMAVLKDRIGGDKGYAALMRYDLGSMQYREDYMLCKRLGSGKVEYVKKNPAWATHAVSMRKDDPNHQGEIEFCDDF